MINFNKKIAKDRAQPILNDHLIETVSGEQSEKEGDFSGLLFLN